MVRETWDRLYLRKRSSSGYVRFSTCAGMDKDNYSHQERAVVRGGGLESSGDIKGKKYDR